MGELISLQSGLSALILLVLALTLVNRFRQPGRPGTGFGIAALLALVKLGLHLYENHYYSLTQLLPYTTMVVILVAAVQQGCERGMVPGIKQNREQGGAEPAPDDAQTLGTGRPVVPFVAVGFILVLLVMGMLKDPKVHESFMMSHPSAILFFISRPLSLGLSVVCLAWSLETIRLIWGGGELGRELGRERSRAAVRAGRLAHDFLVSAQMVFLAGEIAGSLWSFLGWGTTWRWSRTFFFSAMIFVLFLVSAHTPHQLLRHPGRRQMLATLPVLIVIVMLLSSKLG